MGVRILKMGVILGAVLLLIGFVVLIVQVATKERTPSQVTTKPPAEQWLPIATNSKILSITPHGRGSAIWIQGESSEVLIVDEKGQIENRLHFGVKPEPRLPNN
ncbi:MAG: hypothetical protein H7832_12940 [Magnetococcus sp. DMHC-6]